MLKSSPSLYTRQVVLPTALNAHDVYQADCGLFSALLEDPSGKGTHFLASKAGKSIALTSADDANTFFTTWKSSLLDASQCQSYAGIYCLVYASYEASTCLEHLPTPKTPPPLDVLLWLHFPEWNVVFCTDKPSCEIGTTRSAAHLDELESWLLHLAHQAQEPTAAMPVSVESPHTSDEERYKDSIDAVKEYIAAGDIFQANIARFWHTPCPKENVHALYASLRSVNPAPFACVVHIEIDGKACDIISASPERLFHLDSQGVVSTRPIAGTRRRGEEEDDASLQQELLLSEKERAEHIMLVDLERNDLGRVCKPGTVRVTEQMQIEKYTTVQHIVSNIQGELADGYDVVDVFQTMFPGGTITGCPKVRCMEIIHEQEQGARGPYTGGVGYMAWDGSADMNILIRSFWWYHHHLHWAAGAGVVADSIPTHELEETEHKAAGLLRALNLI